MKKYDFQELLLKADENIQIAKQKAKYKDAQPKKTEKSSRDRSAERLSGYIQNMIVEILTDIKSNTGVVDNLDDISKYGNIKDAKWMLDESKLQIVLDFSYAIPGDVLCYTGSRGFKKNNVSWRYLCQLLQEKNIIIEHTNSEKYVGEKDWYGTTYYTNILIITLERIKKMESEEPDVSTNVHKK